MRSLLAICFAFFWIGLSAQSFFDQADQFFSKYVNDGMVDYVAIRKQPQMLDDLVKQIAELDLSNKRVTPEYLKAFYINSYNILVIRQVVDRYPLDGPLAVDGFFNQYHYKVMGRDMTLDDLEKKTLYAQFPDPRLHFVLVCAAKGCPPIANFSYRPGVLESQLEERTKYVLNLAWFIRVNKSNVQLSQIFSWYSKDFGETSQQILSYINKYRTNKIIQSTKISYYEYDWKLNKQ